MSIVLYPCPSIAPIAGQQIKCNKVYQHKGLCYSYEVMVYWCCECELFNCEHSDIDQITHNVSQQITWNIVNILIQEAKDLDTV